MEQARFSNSNFNGSSTTDSPKTKSKGNPSYKSDASKEPSAMVSSSPATGNPLNTTNYSQGYKWGNTYQDKWQNIATRPDEQEKSHTYEGEKIRKKLNIARNLESSVINILISKTYNKAIRFSETQGF